MTKSEQQKYLIDLFVGTAESDIDSVNLAEGSGFGLTSGYKIEFGNFQLKCVWDSSTCLKMVISSKNVGRIIDYFVRNESLCKKYGKVYDKLEDRRLSSPMFDEFYEATKQYRRAKSLNTILKND